jgi:acyl carrier protein
MEKKHQLYEIVRQCVEEWNDQQIRKIPIEQGMLTPLYGKDGYLDSIGLVSVLVSVEQAVEDYFDVEIPLIRESLALSQKDSPFKTVGSLVEFLCGLLHGGKTGEA